MKNYSNFIFWRCTIQWQYIGMVSACMYQYSYLCPYANTQNAVEPYNKATTFIPPSILLYGHSICSVKILLRFFLLNNPFNADPNVLISFLKFTSLMWPLKSSKYFKGRTRNANEQNTSWGNRQIIENSIQSVHEFFLFSSQLK